jgi:hypothetical protein
LDLGAAMRAAQFHDPASIVEVVVGVAAEVGGTNVVLYLADFAQTTLEPVPSRTAHREVPHAEEVATTMAGRAFLAQEPTTAERPDGMRVWVPIVEGSDRTGVLALTVSDGGDEVIATCEELGLFAGYLIATHARSTDLFNVYRRRRALTLAASMQWDLLPPLVLKTSRLTVAGLLEPAYEVGGDCFDYALNDDVFNVAIVDAAGHGISSALIAALTIGSYRRDRREGASLVNVHANLDDAMATHFPVTAFATGQLAQVHLESGTMTWINAGHPLPLLIRGGQVIRELECVPALPWGLGSFAAPGAETMVATEALEPGDSVLFYTDGVIEAHRPGSPGFGVKRLGDIAGRHASDLLEPEAIVRQIVNAVLEHQDDLLDDDATLVLFRWQGSGVATPITRPPAGSAGTNPGAASFRPPTH